MEYDRRLLNRTASLRTMQSVPVIKPLEKQKGGETDWILIEADESEAGRLAAVKLGKQTGRTVYRVNIDRLVAQSKYIGETEKNLVPLFRKAEERGWILFFDEADALFGKRTQVADSHDRYANQEVSYLLRSVAKSKVTCVFVTRSSRRLRTAFLNLCRSMD